MERENQYLNPIDEMDNLKLFQCKCLQSNFYKELKSRIWNIELTHTHTHMEQNMFDFINSNRKNINKSNIFSFKCFQSPRKKEHFTFTHKYMNDDNCRQ